MEANTNKEIHTRVFVISGPSGVGKSSLVRSLLATDQNMRLVISSTTRTARPNEEEGKDYFFITEEEFLIQAKEGCFLEWVFRYGHYYGTPQEQLINLLARGYHVLLDIETNGAQQLRHISEGAVYIFIRPTNQKEIQQRLKARNTEHDTSLNMRLAGIKQEMSQMSHYNFVLENKQNLSHQTLLALRELVASASQEPISFHFNKDTATMIWQKAINDAKIQAIKAMQQHHVIQKIPLHQKQYCMQKVLELIQKQINYSLPGSYP